MTHGSLFSGIGGFDLAAEWAGWTNVFNCENEPFCKQVLKYHFPHAIQYDDIKTTDFTPHRGTIDIVSGGFPCQPFSQAGKKKGTADNRYLWAEMLRAIREIAPRWVVAENVRGIITIEQGMVFERVQSDLENAGYAVQPFIIPACAVGAPHERYRTFFVAHRNDTGTESLRKRTNKVSENGISADTLRIGLEYSLSSRNRLAQFKDADRLTTNTDQFRCSQDNKSEPSEKFEQNIPNWRSFPTVAPVCGGDDGFSIDLDKIALLSGRKPRTQRTAFKKWRKNSLQSFGNAVVPQEVYEFFRIINEVETQI